MTAWRQATTDYVASLRAQGQAVRTLELTEGWLQRFSVFAVEHGVDAPDQLTDRVFDAFQRELWWLTTRRGQLYSSNTRYQGLRMLRSFLHWCYTTQRTPCNPAADLSLTRPASRRPELLTPAEVAQFLACPIRLNAGRDGVVHRLVYHLALERHECHGLDVADVDGAGQRLTVRGLRPRAVPLDEDLAALLAHYLTEVRPALAAPDETALFLGADGHRLGILRYSQLVLAHAKEAGLRPVNFQLLRRSGLAARFARGETVRSIQTLLGHRDATVTRTYRPPVNKPGVVPKPPAKPPRTQQARPMPFYRRPKGTSHAEP